MLRNRHGERQFLFMRETKVLQFFQQIVFLIWKSIYFSIHPEKTKNSGHGKAKPGIRKSMTNGDWTKINFSLSFPDEALSDLQ